MSYIFTYTGKKVFPYMLKPGDFDVLDIAHALSNLCRFTGHTQKFYSVAEHCVHVSYFCKPKDSLWGLLHDATEAYLSDISKPLKHVFPQYKSIKDRTLIALAKQFGMSVHVPDSVHRADLWMLQNEMRDLLGGTRPDSKWIMPGAPFIDLTNPWPPAIAKRCFIERFDFIMEEIEDDRCRSAREHTTEQAAPEHQG